MDGPEALISRLEQVLHGSRFIAGFGLRVSHCAPGECSLVLPFDPDLERPGGIVNGVALMGAADVAMWLAIMTLRGTDEAWVTSDLKTAFLKPARREDVVATARVLKPGRRSMYGTVDCVGQRSGLVAHHVVTYSRIDPV